MSRIAVHVAGHPGQRGLHVPLLLTRVDRDFSIVFDQVKVMQVVSVLVNQRRADLVQRKAHAVRTGASGTKTARLEIQLQPEMMSLTVSLECAPVEVKLS